MILRTKIPLRAMLMAGFLLTSAGPLIGFWYWSHTTVLENEFEEVQERHLLLARNLGSALERYHSDLISVFEIFVGKMARGDDLSFAQTLFRKLRFRHVCVFDTETSDLRMGYFFETNACPEQMPADRNATLRALANESPGKIGMSHVMKTPDGDTVIYMAAVVQQDLVIGAVHTSYFRELGRRISFGRLGHAAIVDHTGRVLSHPLTEWEDAARDISSVSAVQKMLNGESGVERFYSPALKGDMIAGFTGIAGSGWGVMVPQPVVELEETADRVAGSGRIVFALAVALALLLAFFVAGWFSRAINAVADVARRMAAGDTDARVGPDLLAQPVLEISALGTSYNAMADQMQAAQREETALRVTAEDAVAAKGQFLAVMSHEIRTPMNGLLGLAALLRATPLDTQQTRYAERLIESGQSLMNILNDVLDFSQIEAGHVELVHAPFDLCAMVQSVVELMELEALKTGTSLEAMLPEEGGACLTGDRNRVSQVLLNLVGNAIKFTKNGSITIRLEPLEGSSARGYRMFVTDSGIGVPAEAHEKIFEHFVQADSSLRRTHGGTGLGLAISKRLVLAMGGEIGISPNRGEGAEFWFTIVDQAETAED